MGIFNWLFGKNPEKKDEEKEDFSPNAYLRSSMKQEIEDDTFKKLMQLKQDNVVLDSTQTTELLILLMIKNSTDENEANDIRAIKEEIEIFNKSLEVSPDALSYFGRGMSYEKLAFYEKNFYRMAVIEYSEAIELDPNYYLVYLSKAGCHVELNEYKEAISNYTKIIDIGLRGQVVERGAIPIYYLAFLYRGNQKVELDDHNGAIADYTKVVELAIENNVGRGAEPEYSLGVYSKEIKDNKLFKEAYNNRGDSKNQLKDYKGAIGDFNKAVEIDPDYANAYYNRGLSKRLLKNFDGSVSDFTKAIELLPQWDIINKHESSNNTDFMKIEALLTFVCDAYNNRGLSKHDLKDYDGAIEDFDKAIYASNYSFKDAEANKTDSKIQLELDANFKDGKKEGLWKTYHENGQLNVEGNFKDAKKDGLWKMYNKNGQLRYEGNWKDAKKEGLSKTYYENGQLESEGNWKDGNQEELWKTYHENGQLKSEGNLKEGKENGITKIYQENGQLKEEINWREGKQEGVSKIYHKNGQLEVEEYWKDDKPEGLCKYYHDNGQLKIDGNWKDGEKDGLWKTYYENGQLESEENWKDGKSEG